MRKTLFYGIVAAILAAAPANAQSLTGFFGGSNLEPLANGPLVRNLEAQSQNRVPQPNVNAFDDYFLINGTGRLVVNFNGALQIKGLVPISTWIGVAPYSNHEIWFDIQAGFDIVKQHYNMPNAAAGHVVVYKTVNTQQLVYDYAVALQTGRCQEYLFTPATFGFQMGLMTRCHWSLSDFRRPVRPAVRPRKR